LGAVIILPFGGRPLLKARICQAAKQISLPLFKIAFVLLRLDHVASRIVTGINGLKKQAWADLFVTLGFGSLSQIAMSSALRVFTRGMFGFAEIIVVVTLVYLLAAIALLNSFVLSRTNERTALRPHRARHIGN
jgi:hypothetical protein